MKDRKRRAIVVLGMHRSGTSALAGVLALLGAKLPARILPAGRGNLKGHFEPQHIVEIHDRILASAGTTWWGWEEIPEAWFFSAASHSFVDELVAAVSEDYPDTPLFMVKDPRMCRLMPLWYRVFDRIAAEPCFAISLRNPLEVAKSLQNRDGLPLAHGCLMWLRHVLDAECHTRGHPRVFLRYGNLLAEPRTVIDRMRTGLGIVWPRQVESILDEIEDFLDPLLQTQFAQEQEINDVGDVSAWLRQAYESHEALVRSPNDKAAMRRLDSLNVTFAAADAAFTPVFKHRAKQHDSELAALQETLAERQKELTALGRALSERDNQITALGNALVARNTRLAALGEAVALRDRLIAKLCCENAAHQQSLCQLKDDNMRLIDVTNAASQRLKLIENSSTWQASLPLRRALAVLPTPIRRYGRMAFEALWWLLTPHRIPARLRELRARRNNQSCSPNS